MLTAEYGLLSFELPGPPRTKKNHGERIKRGGRIYSVPSEAYREWADAADWSISAIKRAAQARGTKLPIEFDVNCRATFYRHADVGDAVGYYQGLADWLENAGILRNDVQIRSWDGSRLEKDPENPRVVVQLEELPPRVATRRRRKAVKK